jgi:1,4-dihydroxy-2-naphthoyl-CoA synthase
MSGFETVIYEKDNGLAHVTLNRPQALNAFNVRMRDELYEVLSAIKADDEVRVTLINGAGEKAFCAGADLKEFLTAPSAVEAREIRAIRDLWRLFLSVPQPLIAALHGYVLGSGLEIALFCDLRIATPDVVFGLPEVELGILPAAGGTHGNAVNGAPIERSGSIRYASRESTRVSRYTHEGFQGDRAEYRVPESDSSAERQAIINQRIGSDTGAGVGT